MPLPLMCMVRVKAVFTLHGCLRDLSRWCGGVIIAASS